MSELQCYHKSLVEWKYNANIMTDWSLCFICQTVKKDENLRFNDDELASNMPVFDEYGKLRLDLNRIKDGDRDLCTSLSEGE